MLLCALCETEIDIEAEAGHPASPTTFKTSRGLVPAHRYCAEIQKAVKRDNSRQAPLY